MTRTKHTLQQMLALFLSLCLMTMQLCVPVSSNATASTSSTPDFSYLGAVGNLTAEETLAIAQTLYNAVMNQKTSISLAGSTLGKYGFTLDQIEDIRLVCRAVIYNYEECLLVSSAIPASYNTVTNLLSSLQLSYVYEGNSDTAYATAVELLDEIEAQIDPDWSDTQKVLYLYDYIGVTYGYDTEEEKVTAYETLTTNEGVCNSFAWIFTLLCTRLGIPSSLVQSNSLGHIWNAVELDDEWYYLDVTWDDVSYNKPGSIHHKYCLLSYEAFEHEATDWVIVPNYYDFDDYESANSTIYDDAIWHGAVSPLLAYDEDTWVFAWRGNTSTTRYTTTVYKCGIDFSTGEAIDLEQFQRYISTWQSYTLAGYIKSNVYATCALAEDVIFYTLAQKIYALVPDTDGNFTNVEVYTLTDDQVDIGEIYGMRIDGTTLYYYLDTQGTSNTWDEYTLDISSYLSTKDDEEEPTADITEETTDDITEETTEDITEETTEDITEETTEDITEERSECAGDVDGDGCVNILDLIALQKHLLGIASLSEENSESADLDSNGFVTVYDLVILRRILLES